MDLDLTGKTLDIGVGACVGVFNRRRGPNDIGHPSMAVFTTYLHSCDRIDNEAKPGGGLGRICNMGTMSHFLALGHHSWS